MVLGIWKAELGTFPSYIQDEWLKQRTLVLSEKNTQSEGAFFLVGHSVNYGFHWVALDRIEVYPRVLLLVYLADGSHVVSSNH